MSNKFMKFIRILQHGGLYMLWRTGKPATEDNSFAAFYVWLLDKRRIAKQTREESREKYKDLKY